MFAVVIPVGPGDHELSRLAALISELRRHERAADLALFVVDDAPCARDMEGLWPTQTIIRTELRRNYRPDVLSAHVAGTLEALAAVREAGLEFAVKLDTDVCVIGQFSEALRAAFADPTLGVVGSYDRTSTGGTRDWSMWPPLIAAADRPVGIRRGVRGVRLVLRRRDQREHIRRVRKAAFDTAPAGAHCLGGAYAVSGAFLGRASLAWRPWIYSGLGEDVVVGMLCSAAGLGMRGLTAPGEPFALAWRGLPAPPRELAAGGYSIVHSIKAGSPLEEEQLRDDLQRAAAHLRM